MANPFDKLAPADFSKIAQNDNMNGEVLSVVYYNKPKGEFFIQVLADNKEFVTLGPMKAHTFNSLTQIMSDVKDMEHKFHVLD